METRKQAYLRRGVANKKVTFLDESEFRKKVSDTFNLGTTEFKLYEGIFEVDFEGIDPNKPLVIVLSDEPAPSQAPPPSLSAQVMTSLKNFLRGDAPPNKTWFVKDLNHNFSDGIPDYLDYHGLRSQLTNEFKATAEPPTILMMDVPGAGKTTTIFRAAVDIGACYIRVRASLTAVLLSLSDSLKLVCKNLPDTMPEADLKGCFYPLCYGALLRIFQQALIYVQNGNKQILNIPLNGILPSTLDNTTAAMETLVKTLRQKGDQDPRVILHLDELQAWAVTFDFTRKDCVNKADYDSYTLIAFSNALQHVINAQSCFRVALSGTNALQGKAIVTGSELKLKVFSIPQMPVGITQTLMVKYLDLDLPNFRTHELAGLFFQISSNARALQYFLVECQTHGAQLTTDQITVSQVQKWIESAFSQWTNTVSTKIADESSAWIAWFILICTHPMPNVTDLGDKIRLPVANVPRAFLEAAQQGILQFIETAGFCEIPKPQGFLLRYATTKAKTMHVEDLAQVFAWTFAAATEKIGSPGHLFERLVSTELTIPISSLYTIIIKSLEAEQMLMADYKVSLQCVQYDSNIASLPTLKNQVHCVLDRNDQHDRVVDVAVPMRSIGGQAEVILYLDAKTLANPNELWKACYSFFTDPRVPTDSPRIFLSLYPFQNSAAPQNRTAKKGISAAFAYSEVKAIIAKKSTCTGGWLKFAILDGENNFSGCQLGISIDSIKKLESVDVNSTDPSGVIKPFMKALMPRKRKLEGSQPMGRSDTLSWFQK